MKFSDEFYTVEKISPRKEKTPEGYLLCRDVPISRTGVFKYTSTESCVASSSGIAEITRSPEELFSESTISSFEGKPVVISHAHFATPENWKEISVGVAQNVRQDGENLLADLLLTDAKAIEIVESGELSEVSCGYEANTVADADGKGHQECIVGNHIALVKKARCSGCRIGDSAMTSIKGFLHRLFKDECAEKLEEMLNDEDTEGEKPEESKEPSVEERLAKYEEDVKCLKAELEGCKDTLGKILSALEDEEEEEKTSDESNECEDEDEKGDDPEESESKQELAQEKKSEEEDAPDQKDEAVPQEKLEEVLADAECIDPDGKKPCADSENGITQGVLEDFMRKTMKGAGVTKFGDVDSLDGKALEFAFKASAEIAKASRNPKAKINDGLETPKHRDINAINQNYWRN